MKAKSKLKSSRCLKAVILTTRLAGPRRLDCLLTNIPTSAPKLDGNTQEMLLGDFVDPITASRCLQTWRWQAVSGFWPANVVPYAEKRDTPARKDGTRTRRTDSPSGL